MHISDSDPSPVQLLPRGAVSIKLQIRVRERVPFSQDTEHFDHVTHSVQCPSTIENININKVHHSMNTNWYEVHFNEN